MKKWTEEEFTLCIDYVNKGFSYDEISEFLNRTKKSVRLKLNKLGIYTIPKEYSIEKLCSYCDENFTSLISEDRKFCSLSCAAKKNNKLYVKRVKNNLVNINDTEKCNHIEKQNNNCLNCNKEVNNTSKKYCNNNCFQEYRKKKTIDLIETGDTTLSSRQYKNYLIEKYGNKCMECGWGEKNPKSNTIPIELEHIDGNSSNNNLCNLKLLCPNCHSLTPTYKGANKGNGRYNRRDRYKEGKSF
jgi:hypothetical protein